MTDTFTITKPVVDHQQTADRANHADIVFLPSGEFRFVTKDEIVSHCQISINTFQNWLSYTPAEEFEVKTTKGNKKLFRIDYVEKLFNKHGEIKDFQKLLSVPSQEQTNDKSVADELVKAKDETIEILKAQNQLLTEQLANQQQTIGNLTDAVKQSQFLQNEANKQIQKLEQDKLLLLEEKTTAQNPPKKGFWNWF